MDIVLLLNCVHNWKYSIFAYFISVKIFLSLYEENHLGNCCVIQSVNCVSQDMSVLFPHANQLLVQKIAEILYAYWYILHFFILHVL